MSIKKIIFNFILLYCFTNISAQYMWQIKKDTVITWYYKDGDEFNDDHLNREKWNTGLSWGRAIMSQDLYFTDGEDLEEKNGTLNFSLSKRDRKIKLTPWEVDSTFNE